MQLVVLALMVVALAWLAARAGFRVSDQAVAALVRGFTAWRGADWPRGVQEEDRDRPWGRSATPPTLPALPTPNLNRVRPAVHTR